MRERLVELINKARDKYPNIPLVNGCKQDFAVFFADYLLNNGVVLPPCKVGDAVYIVDRISDSVVSGRVTHFEYNLYTTPKEWMTVVSNELWCGKTEIMNRIDLLIGKTVFFNREDAERALKGETK